MLDKIVMYTDGGSRGNPGPAGGAYLIYDLSGNLIAGKGKFISNATNNVAEYTGMLEGLKQAQKIGAAQIEIFSDSELMVKQLNGVYRVKSDNLKNIYASCMELLSSFESWSAEHVLREENIEADKLANRAMDEKRDVSEETLPFQANQPAQKALRLGILISGGGTTMVNIQKEIDAGRLNAEIAVVISSLSTVRGVDIAKSMGLSLEVVRKKDFDSIEDFSRKIEQVLTEHDVDLVVQAGWLCLWRIPQKYDGRVMNIHPALLPAFGGKGMWGRNVHEAVLKRGCKVSGCTVHFCTNEYDQGPIIVQRCCEARDEDDPETLAARVFEQECIAYPQAIRMFSEDRLKIENGIVKIRYNNFN